MSDPQEPIPQTNPKAGYLAHKTEIDAAIQQMLDSGWYILGEQVRQFESEFAQYIGVNHATGVGNGTDAIELALQACGVGVGDGVFTVSHTAVATVAAIERVGATPILLDIDPNTYTLDTEQLKQALTGQTGEVTPKAVIPVHLYGHPANLDGILSLAKAHQLFVIEDCAQSHGALWHNRKTGSFGDLATYSFYPTKNLGALGDGGMVTTNSQDLAEAVQGLRQYGWQKRYISQTQGGNSRLDEMQAAILRVKLTHLDEDNNARQKIAAVYDQTITTGKINLPTVSTGASHVYHQYVIRTPHRDQLRQFLLDHQVRTGIHYPQPVHKQPAYAARLGTPSLPVTEQIADEILSLPMYPQMTTTQAERVASLINRWSIR